MSQVLVAHYIAEVVFRIPKGVVLTPDNHHVKWNVLYIHLPDGQELKIQPSVESEPDYKYPNTTEVQLADNWAFDDSSPSSDGSE